MKILIFGDSNTYGGYQPKDEWIKYNEEDLWYYPLMKNNDVIVDGLCGRAINSEHEYKKGRNGMKALKEVLDKDDFDLIAIQLGTNDCKTFYGFSAEDICGQMENMINLINQRSGAKVLLLSPAQLIDLPINHKVYHDSYDKPLKLVPLYKNLAKKYSCYFVSAYGCEIGEDGEHLTLKGHKQLAKLIQNELAYQDCREDSLK